MPKWSEKLKRISDAIDIGRKGIDCGISDFDLAMGNVQILKDIQKKLCTQNDIRKVSKIL